MRDFVAGKRNEANKQQLNCSILFQKVRRSRSSAIQLAALMMLLINNYGEKKYRERLLLVPHYIKQTYIMS